MQGRDTATIIVVAVLVVLLFGLLGGGMMMGPWMMGWAGYGFNPLWGVLMMLVWVVIIGGGAWLAVRLLQQGHPLEIGPAPSGRALEILRERYAKGEITLEQYEQMRRDLGEK